MSVLAFGWANACESEHQPALSKHECTTNHFRACDGGGCRGVQQCVDPGFWSECDCVVGDASYADNGSDAVDGGGEEADDAQSEDAADADLDANSDAEAGDS